MRTAKAENELKDIAQIKANPGHDCSVIRELPELAQPTSKELLKKYKGRLFSRPLNVQSGLFEREVIFQLAGRYLSISDMSFS